MDNFRSPSSQEWSDFKDEVSKALKDKSILRRIDGKTTMYVGDIHGYFNNLRCALKVASMKNVDNLIFLGDYIDRGPEQLRTALDIINAFAISEGMKPQFDFIDSEFNDKYPFKIIALRGNHDDEYYCLNHDFYKELYSFYPNQEVSLKYLDIIGSIFNHLPFIIESSRGTIAIHGGIPKPKNSNTMGQFLQNISNVKTPCSEPEPNPDIISLDEPEKEIEVILGQMVWNDVLPKDITTKPYFRGSMRGDYIYEFNYGAWLSLANEKKYQRLVRAHDATLGAYSVLWNNQLIHIFSAYPYSGYIKNLAFFIEYEDGTGAILDENGDTILKVEKPYFE